VADATLRNSTIGITVTGDDQVNKIVKSFILSIEPAAVEEEAKVVESNYTFVLEEEEEKVEKVKNFTIKMEIVPV